VVGGAALIMVQDWRVARRRSASVPAGAATSAP
jgi:hypothetical protein